VVSMHEEIFYNFDFSGMIGGYLVTLEKKWFVCNVGPCINDVTFFV
jgi:hypothetical protein